MPNQSSDIVFINDLTLNMSAGIYEQEKQNTQRVIVNVLVHVATNKGKELKSIDDVVSYEDITKKIQSLADEKHYELLEEFAEKIAALCLQYEHVQSASVKVEKPDIIKDTVSVGIEIFRSK